MSRFQEQGKLIARLAAGRGQLLAELLGLDEETLTETPCLERWTVKDLLAHIAAWDRWEYRQMKRSLAGEPPEDVAVDAFNAAAVTEWRDRSLNEVLDELQDARAFWIAWLRDLPENVFFENRSFQDRDWTFPHCLEIQWRHDAEHVAQIAAWREEQQLEEDAGFKGLLLAALNATREELLTAAAMATPAERASRPICGAWTLKDVLGHVADWEWVGVEGLRRMAAGRPLDIAYIADIDAWNERQAQARADQPWEEIWADLHAAREELLEILDGMRQADLMRSYVFPWGPEGVAYQWLSAFISHDREHAQGLRSEMGAEEE